MITLTPRSAPSRVWSVAAPLLAVALTLIAGAALFAAMGKPPLEALRVIFLDPLFSNISSYTRPQLLVKAAPLALIAMGLSLGFRAGIWNIGAEGQYIIGALCGAAVGLALYPMESRLIFPLMVLAGALGGILWAMIPALLKLRFDANEILVSLMLVYVAEKLLGAAALGWLRNPEGMGFPGSRNLAQWAASANPELLANTGIHWGVVTALLVAVAAQVVITRHLFGLHLTLMGQALRAARFAGVRPEVMVPLCLGLSGALAGLAGIFEVTGPAGQITIDFNVGYGFTAIIVAFLGRLTPIGIVLAALLMALTYIGGELAQAQLGLPGAAIQMFQGMLLFFLLAVDVLTRFRITLGRAAHAG